MNIFTYLAHPPSYDAAEVFYVRVHPEITVSDELIKFFAYALWFPGYFGFNWDALRDCLCDFNWIPVYKIVVVHEHLPEISIQDQGIYLDLLSEAVELWNKYPEHELEIVFKLTEKNRIERIMSDYQSTGNSVGG